MTEEQQLSLALEYGDMLRASMAGNLRSHEFEGAKGQVWIVCSLAACSGAPSAACSMLRRSLPSATWCIQLGHR